jgi:hypothetical protein
VHVAVRDTVYRQAGLLRLAEARALLHHEPAFPAGAIYLGGYALECLFKWSICRRAEPRPVRYLEDLPDSGLAQRLLSARGHDLEFLANASGAWPAIRAHDRLRRHLSLANIWAVRLRYSAKSGDFGSATKFLASVEVLVRWLAEWTG